MNTPVVLTDDMVALFNSVESELDLLRLEYSMLQVGEPYKANYGTNHHLANGIYVRELVMPAGSFAIGKEHVHNNTLNIILKGSVTFMDGDGTIKTLNAPLTYVSTSGKKKYGFFLEDTVWLTIHNTNAKSVEEAEKELFIESDYSILDNSIRKIQ